MISDTEYARAVAEFLSEKGVTRCPTACVVPTHADVSDADRAALRDHEAARDAVRRARRRELQQKFSQQPAPQDRYAAAAAPPVSDPGNAACVSP